MMFTVFGVILGFLEQGTFRLAFGSCALGIYVVAVGCILWSHYDTSWIHDKEVRATLSVRISNPRM